MKTNRRYSKAFKINVVKEALKEEFENQEYLIANKYGIKEGTVIKWKNNYLEHGHFGLSKGFMSRVKESTKHKDKEIEKQKKEIDELKEEIVILKKAAAFLAMLERD